MNARPLKRTGAAGSRQSLSPRERQILERRQLGHTCKAVAADLGISVHTVKCYLGRAFHKLNVQSSLEAVGRLQN